MNLKLIIRDKVNKRYRIVKFKIMMKQKILKIKQAHKRKNKNKKI